jgi:hypothetical protein
LINETTEVNDFLKNIRYVNIEDINNNRDDKDKLLYKFVFNIIEEIFNIEDKEHLSFIMSNLDEELRVDIIYYFRDVFNLIYRKLDDFLSDYKSLFEKFSNDYMSDNELIEILSRIDVLFNDLLFEVKKSNELNLFKVKIINWIDKKNTISNIK